MILNPLFSVLIANHNNGRFLQEAIDSVLEQTYSKWEIVIVDDGSTDDSYQVYGRYKNDDRFHVYYNGQNMGCGYTKRKCVEFARGEICGFVDPDDKITPNAIEVSVNVHVHNDDVSLVYSNFYYCDSDLNIQGVSSHQCTIPPDHSFLTYKKGAVSHFATFKRQCYLQTLGINPDFKRAIDMDLYYKLEEVGKLYHIDIPLYFYRQGTGTNISLGEHSNRAELWNVVAKIDACRRRNLPLEETVFPFVEMCTKEKIDFAKHERSEEIYNSWPYRIGKSVLAPIKCLKKMLH